MNQFLRTQLIINKIRPIPNFWPMPIKWSDSVSWVDTKTTNFFICTIYTDQTGFWNNTEYEKPLLPNYFHTYLKKL